MENRARYYKSIFEYIIGEGFYFPLYQGRQYGYEFNVYYGRPHIRAILRDVLGGIWRYFRPVAISGAKSFLKAGSEAIKDSATLKDVLKKTLKPTVGSRLGAKRRTAR